MAAALLESIGREEKLPLEIRSAGTAALAGQPAAEQAVEVMRRRGQDLSGHRSTPLGAEAVRWADVILVMTGGHRRQVLQAWPEAAGKTHLLAELAGRGKVDVPDPVGQEIAVYEATADRLEQDLRKIVQQWKRDESGRKSMRKGELPEGGGVMRIALGSDHAGFKLKEQVMEWLDEWGYEYVDVGTHSEESCDYPDYARRVAEAVVRGDVDRGILICGTGIGMSITANKVRGVRAALCHDVFSARAAREHNDANILCMGARVVGPGPARETVKAWLEAEFTGGRHQRRIDKIRELEEA